MEQFNDPASRISEILLGLITSFIGLVFFGLFLMLILNAGLKLVTVIVGAILLLAIYWFGLISIRLIFNIPNKNGGLFSIGGMKFLCVFLGITSLMALPIAVYLQIWVAALGSMLLIVGCYKGWQNATNKKNA